MMDTLNETKISTDAKTPPPSGPPVWSEDLMKATRNIGISEGLTSQKTRASLLERLRDWRDRESWEDFFDTYWKLIYGTARKSNLSDYEAQEVVQETLISVSRRFPQFRYDARGSFRVWLRRLTRWRVVDQVRKRKPHWVSANAPVDGEESVDLIANLPDPASLVPNDIWEKDWQKTLVEAGLARIRSRVKPRTYQLFDFYVNKDWPAEKVAERFGVSTAVVHLAKCRILDMLKQEVARLEKETI
jgi:RNA polymerase sigma-70 factor (ECF subfamily)